MRHTYEKDGIPLATAEITPLPGCPQVAVIHNAFVVPSARGVGAGMAAHADRLVALERHLYDMAVCTADDANEPQIRILLAAGWSRAGSFTSRRTGNRVSLWTRPLNDTGDQA